MGQFRAVFYTSCFDNNPSPFDEPSFQAFAEALVASGHRRGGKDGIAISPAVFRPGATRKLANVEAVTAVGLDLEHGSPARMAEVRETLKAFEHVLYTTHSHTPEAPRYRAIIALEREVPASLHPQLWALVTEMVGKDVCDPATKDASRLFYLPSAPEGAPTELEYWPADGKERFAIDPLAALGLTEAQYADALARSAAPSLGPSAPALNIVDGLIEKTGALALKPRPSADDLKGRVLAGEPNQWRTNLERLFAGEPFALAGGRDIAAFGCASTIAWVAPEADVDDIAQLFEASVDAMWKANTDVNNPPPTMDQIRAKVRRAINERRTRWYEERAFMEEAHALSTKPTAPVSMLTDGPEPAGEAPELPKEPQPSFAEVGSGPGHRIEPYTDSETEAFFKRHHVTAMDFFGLHHTKEDGPRPHGRGGQAIIQLGDSYFVFGGRKGQYLPPVQSNSVMASLARDWAPFIAEGVIDLWKEVTVNGAMKRRKKTLQELVQDYGSVARSGRIHIGLRESYYDPETHVFTEAACPVRADIVPKYHKFIDIWMRHLGGDNADKLLDFVATVTLTHRQSAALLLEGAPGSGKSMLYQGLARLWGQPTGADLGHVLSDFNDSLMLTPLVVADEQIPGKRRSADLRALIGSESRPLSRKYMPVVQMIGALRLVLTANNDKLLGLAADEELTVDDVDAVGSRFIHIHTPRAAADYLRTLGGREATELWVAGDEIAQHALWLRDNRKVKPGDRFLVEGSVGKLARELATRSPLASSVVEWVVGYCMDGGKLLASMSKADLVKVGNGDILVSAEALREKPIWESYVQGARMPLVPEISSTLENLSRAQLWLGVAGKRRKYYSVRTDLVVGWAERRGVGDPLALSMLISAQVPKFTVVDLQAEKTAAEAKPPDAAAEDKK